VGNTVDRGESGTLTVLVIDDSDVIQRLVERVLAAAGCRILRAMDGPEGLRIYRDEREAIDVILLDIVMPTLSGTVVYQRIRAADRAVPIVVLSSLSAGETGIGFSADPRTVFLPKPFGVDDLVAAVEAFRQGAPKR
jgi:DNA-binding response OmpR family regulator